MRWLVRMIPLPVLWVGLEVLRAHDPRLALLTGAVLLALAFGLGRHAWALVLDEPTNHLDLPTVERLENALAAYPGCIVLVTHDDAFARSCTTSAIDLGGSDALELRHVR